MEETGQIKQNSTERSDRPIISNDAIDLIALIKRIWIKKNLFLKVTAFFAIVGIIIAFTSRVEFIASCKLVPNSQDSAVPKLGGLSNLAGLAGINLSGLESSTITPDLYPQLVSSLPFIEELINKPIYFEKIDTVISSYQYFKEFDSPTVWGYLLQYSIGLPGQIKQLVSTSDNSARKNYDLVRYSTEDWLLIEGFKKRLGISVDQITGVIRVSAKMPDPVASAMVTDLMVKQLKLSIINYKISKSKVNLDFLERRFNEAKKTYYDKQKMIARYLDSNKNILSASKKVEYEMLQNELTISFEVFKGLSTQFEQAKIKVKEDTPDFNILDPVRIPEKRSNPKRVFIFIVCISIGILSAITYIFLIQDQH